MGRLCREKGISVMAAMHDPNLAAMFADDIIMIKNGRVPAGGSEGGGHDRRKHLRPL